MLMTIRCAVNRVIPEDDWPAGWEGGVGEYLSAVNSDTASAMASLGKLAEILDDRAGGSFASLTTEQQDVVLNSLAPQAAEGQLFALLRKLCWEGYYAARPSARPAGLDMIGFSRLARSPDPVDSVPAPTVTSQTVLDEYDAVIIGSGPGGGAAALALAEGGKRVLIIERAPAVPTAELIGDHLHGKRNAVYGVTAGPGPGHPRELVLPDRSVRVVDGDHDASEYGMNAMTLGGGTRLWQAQAWRFMPEDFAMATVYGNPPGASLADWPFDYAELEPYYEQAEHILGVSGEQGPLTKRTPRHADYPMPAFTTEPGREVLAAGARKLGWKWGPVPLALNSVPYDGRPACVKCPSCIGQACPVNAKNGSHNTLIPRAIATGRCDLLLDTQVVRVLDRKKSAAVECITDASSDPKKRAIHASVVVVSAGAVETPRLLLASGLGNETLGRNLHDHRTVTVVGQVGQAVQNFVGPGHTIATLDHAHSQTIPWGGGLLVDLLGILPLTSASEKFVPGLPQWGLEHKEWMRDGRRFVFGVFGIGQEIPVSDSTVTLANAKDRWGVPGARMLKIVHSTSREVESGMERMASTWLRASDASLIHKHQGRAIVSAAGEHSAGTARMGNDPSTSATDARGRLHGSHRVYVSDASLHPTNGSVNPALTIVANGLRVGSLLLKNGLD